MRGWTGGEGTGIEGMGRGGRRRGRGGGDRGWGVCKDLGKKLEEADRLAKEASLGAAAMKSDTEVVTMADIKQAAVKMGLSQLQRQWESSETGRTLLDINQKLQIDLKLIIQIPSHTGKLLSSDWFNS